MHLLHGMNKYSGTSQCGKLFSKKELKGKMQFVLLVFLLQNISVEKA
jgi:hypothetical protein